MEVVFEFSDEAKTESDSVIYRIGMHSRMILIHRKSSKACSYHEQLASFYYVD